MEKFENDIIEFIKNHKYIKEEETEVIINSKNDETKLTIPTVNGNYEEIVIIIIGKP